ncbi:MAG TPA: response regulator transcription factor [Bryobacteraceae bacterium]|nr:response regulator transcription factor [Bryobacteraceae bacterium]
MRILLIEDHQVLRDTVIECLKREYPHSTFGVAGSDKEARIRLTEYWDLALVDIGLPDGSGFVLLANIKANWPKTKLIVLTASSEKNNALAALNNGADGFVSKRASFIEFSEAIRQVCAGKRYFSECILDGLFARASGRMRTPPLLSPKELDVVRLIANGLTSDQIANVMHVSPKTIGTYRTRIYQKLDVRGVAELIRFTIEHQMIDISIVPRPTLEKVIAAAS